MNPGDTLGIPLTEWEVKTGVKAVNGATFPLDGGAVLKLFNVNEPPLLVAEVVGIECLALFPDASTTKQNKGELRSLIDQDLPAEE
jgi:hypothetical protein